MTARQNTPIAFELGHELPHGLGITGDHARARAVADRDIDPVLPTGEPLGGLAHGKIYDSHRAPPAGALHERAAAADDPHRAIDIDHSGDASGRHFSHAVADDGGGNHAELGQEPGIGDRERDEDRLDDADFIEPGRRPGPNRLPTAR